MEQIIKADKTGNFKIPRHIKAFLGLKKNDNLFVFGSSDVIIIKKIKPKSLKERFEDFSDRIAEKFEENGITEDDILKAVEWARK